MLLLLLLESIDASSLSLLLLELIEAPPSCMLTLYSIWLLSVEPSSEIESDGIILLFSVWETGIFVVLDELAGIYVFSGTALDFLI